MKTVSKSRLVLCVIGFLFSFCSYSQIPIYNSYPSAPATIYLDFDGHYLEGTSWNYNGPLTLGPSNLTSSQITEIFNRIAEDYRPFKINITTDSNKYLQAPPTQRMRVLFTITSDWYGPAGGVSYIGSFTWGDNTPCFVFTALLNYQTKYVAEAGSHEIGHTLGLNHQSAYDAGCNKTNEYNAGIGSGEIAWAPIMGVGYYRNFTLWHYGSDPWGCSSYQDDLSIITSSDNGFGYRDDDYGATTNNSATAANFVNGRFSVSGVIEKVDDQDVFKFTMPAKGMFRLDANPYNVGTGDNGSNLDVKLELLSGRNVVNTYNPDLLLNATIDTILSAGTYYLRVQNSSNLYASNYASLGSYTLNGSLIPTGAVLPLHRLELNGSNDNGKHKLNWIIEADEKLVQQTLEISLDGRNFQSLGSLNTSDRTYTYLPGGSNVVYYRLNVSLDNGKQYFSNILVLKNAAVKPSLISNLVRNSIQVNSPSSFDYTLLDHSGRTITKGKLVQGVNMISTSSLGEGMYIIQFSKEGEQYAEKFIKK
jgi:hypothetical protein